MTRTKKDGKIIWGHKGLPDTYGVAPNTPDALVMKEWRRQQEVIRAEEAGPPKRKPRKRSRPKSKRAKKPLTN